MGVGKTTFITSLCHTLGTFDLVSIPSFSIINEYTTEIGQQIFHFDFYRIKNPDELLDIGFDEYCTDDAFCFIEWPEKAENIVPPDFLHIQMEEVDSETRALTFLI
jgi:tRNA threonylcarbamoyladenosine biosynthesis protein TsaE